MVLWRMSSFRVDEADDVELSDDAEPDDVEDEDVVDDESSYSAASGTGGSEYIPKYKHPIVKISKPLIKNLANN